MARNSGIGLAGGGGAVPGFVIQPAGTRRRSAVLENVNDVTPPHINSSNFSKPVVIFERSDTPGQLHSLLLELDTNTTPAGAGPLEDFGRVRLFINDDRVPVCDEQLNHFFKRAKYGLAANPSNTWPLSTVFPQVASTPRHQTGRPLGANFTSSWSGFYERELFAPWTKYVRLEYENMSGTITYGWRQRGTAALPSIQEFTVEAGVTGGTFVMTAPGIGTTGAIAYNATPATLAANVQTALRALGGALTGCTVAAGSAVAVIGGAGQFVVTFAGNGAQALIQPDGGNLTGAAWGNNPALHNVPIHAFFTASYSDTTQPTNSQLATWRSEHLINSQTPRLAPVTICDILGAGQVECIYIGYELPTAAADAIEEGDVSVFVDGEAVASIRSTGTEDFFGSGYNARVLNGYPSGGMAGDGTARDVPAAEGGITLAQAGAGYWRYFPNDPIVFTTELKVCWNVGQADESNGLGDPTAKVFATVDYWLNTAPAINYTTAGVTLSNPPLTVNPAGFTRSGQWAAAAGMISTTDWTGFGDNFFDTTGGVGVGGINDYEVSCDVRINGAMSGALAFDIGTAGNGGDGQPNVNRVRIPVSGWDAGSNGVLNADVITVGLNDGDPDVWTVNGTQTAATIIANGFITVTAHTATNNHLAANNETVAVTTPQHVPEVALGVRGLNTGANAGDKGHCSSLNLNRFDDFGWTLGFCEQGDFKQHPVMINSGANFANQWLSLKLRVEMIDGVSWVTGYWKLQADTVWQPVARWKATNATGTPCFYEFFAKADVENWLVKALTRVTS